MRQLELFRDAPRHYIMAVERLGWLDFIGVDTALEAHRRVFPGGPDPGPVERAARWLRDAVPPVPGPEAGADALALCRILAEGRAPEPFLRERPDLCLRAASRVAAVFLGAARSRGSPLDAPLAQGLPWGVFALWTGEWHEARAALEAAVRRDPEAGLAWLALGDALVGLGRPQAARAAYREGFGLLPREEAWAVADPELPRRRAELGSDAAWAGPWWAVGAYEEGVFPRYGRLGPRDLEARAARFHRLWERGRAPEAFFQGLAISEQGAQAPLDLCAGVRRRMRELRPEAFHRHMERRGAR